MVSSETTIPHDAIAEQRFGTLILGDEREQAMLDLVPFAGSRWQMMDFDWYVEFIGKAVQFKFPQPHTRAVRSAALGGDEQAACDRIANAVSHGAAELLDQEIVHTHFFWVALLASLAAGVLEIADQFLLLWRVNQDENGASIRMRRSSRVWA